MKIAFVGQKGVPMIFGGVETYVEKVAVGLQKRGHQCFVYARPWYSEPNKKTYKGIKIIHLKSIKTKNLDTITHVFRASLDVLKKDYDVVHYHGVGPSLLAWIPKIFKPSVKVVTTFQCLDRKHQKWGWFARLMLLLGEWCTVRFAHKVIAVTHVLQKYIKKNYKAETIYVPNGIDKPRKVGFNLIKKEFGLEKNGYLVFVSRLIKHKGAQYLIEAYKNLKEKGLIKNKKLVIVGDATFKSDYVKKLQSLAGNDLDIIFAGYQTGEMLEQLFSNAYLMVHPSEAEGLPFVVLEAMSYGKGILASDIPELKEPLAGGNGFLFKNKSVKSLENKLARLLKSPVLVKKTGQKARQHALKNYNWKNIILDIERVYKIALLDEDKNKKMINKYLLSISR